MVHGFEWDEGNWPKCAKHGLTKAEIESVFNGEIFVFDDPHAPDAEKRQRAIGVSAGGRHVFIVFTLRMRGKQTFIRPITARYMHRKEIEHYDRQN
jgi:uncharacterized protein